MSVPDIGGTWILYGKPQQEGQTGSGQVEVTIRQHGTDLTGHMVQKIDPWTQAPPADPEATRASLIGRIYVSETQPATLIEIVRLNEQNDFKAIFTGIVSPDSREINGHVVNSRGNLGSIRMEKAT
ncbi:MAG: hypothetical protein ETSY1_23570 [Candidatus Entotheonella factor]|uniref:Uncharacterized protein n=1 Tax=Entotheonella factor TaxID=1429438 RepID=W4LGI4_ENTF1|nr:hypothetical protein [Candidatus Entotheonella palauensis]ETW97208.1 MAG: hypothetical protein ETSY1_23570 [Candidatus Entotheonella factor]